MRTLAGPTGLLPHGSPLLERDEQLDALRALLAEARSGSGSLAFVSGEAGAGKTALISAFLESSGIERVLLGACDGVSTPRPLGPLHDMTPNLGARARGLLSEAEPDRQQLFDTLLDYMRERPPSLVVIEDLHWSDEATLDLLRFVGRRAGQLPTLVVATYRDDEVAPFDPLHMVLGDLASFSWTHRIRVPPLSRAAVEALVGGRAIDTDRLYRLTGGNPFFIGEALAGGDEAVPPTVRDAIRARVARLSLRGRHALAAAAVLGVHVEPWLLAGMVEEDAPGIDECLASGLLVRDGETIAFRHELTRIAVLDDIPLIRGVGLHRRALRLLTRASSDDSARLAYHAEGAADGPAVIRHAPVAGARAVKLAAHAVAIAQFRRALKFGEHMSQQQRAEILELMAYELFLTNRLGDAHEARSAALALREAEGNRLRVGDDRRYLSRVAWFMGRGPEAWEHARAAIDALAPLGRTRELAMAMGNLGHLHMIAEDLEPALEWGHRALELGRELNDAEVIAYTLNNIGSAELQASREEGRARLMESLRIAKQHQMQEHIDRALFNLGESALGHHRYQLAEEYLVECLEFTLSCDLERCQLLADASRAHARMEMGQWDEAERMARVVVDHPRSSPHGRIEALSVLARLAARRGDPVAVDTLAEADQLAAGAGEIGRVGAVAVTRAEIAWLAGDSAAAIEAARAVMPLAVARGNEWIRGELAAWQWRAGARDLDSEGLAEPFALEISGQPERAAAAWDSMGNRYQAALCRAASRDPERVREAHAALLALGATAPAAIVAGRLRALGATVPRGPRSATLANPAQLTEREAEIATLLAEGLTNREIAHRLVIAEKTVGHHVSSVLGKLAVRRRGEVASALAEHRSTPR